MRPDASVVIATYQGEAFIAETIESVLAQRARSFELIVCDDGSRDATPEIVRGYGRRLQLISQENQGVSVARNAGAARATGRLLAFLDQDDLWEPELLDELCRHLDQHADEGLVYADSWIIDSAGRRHGRRSEYLAYRSGLVFDALLQGNFIPIETSLFRKQAFDALGGFDPRWRLLEDHELCLRLARRWPIGFVPRALASYRIHDRNLSHDIIGLLEEWVELLDGLPARMPDLSPEQLERLPRLLSRQRGELAWQLIRRLELARARREIELAGADCPFRLRFKNGTAVRVLGTLPQPWARSLLRLLPERRLYGLRCGSSGRRASANSATE